MGQQNGLNQQLTAANGVGTQQSAIRGLQGLAGQQQNTAGMYQNIASGTGPNPAQAALNQSTGQNVANQAALMAGQRGASQNVGLLARQAAQQGAATQQQAVGQGATLQAQQQLAGLAGLQGAQAAIGNTQQAIGGLGTTQANMQQAGINNMAGQGAALTAAQQQAIAQQASQSQAQIAAQQAQQGMLASQASNQVAQQQAAQNAVAGQTNVMAGQQLGQTNATNAAQQANANALMAGLGNQNTANVSMQGNINQGNAALAAQNMQGQQAMIGGVMNSIGSVGGLMKAQGGYIGHYAEGTPDAPVEEELTAPPAPEVPMPAPAPAAPITPPATQMNANAQQPVQGPQSSYGQFISNPSMGYGSQALQAGVTKAGTAAGQAFKDTIGKITGGGGGDMDGAMTAGGAADAGEGGMGALALMAAAKGGMAHNLKGGGNVIAKNEKEKAKAKGNDYKNDTVPALLSEGEIVLPRSVTQSKDPVKSAADFVAKVMAKRRAGK